MVWPSHSLPEERQAEPNLLTGFKRAVSCCGLSMISLGLFHAPSHTTESSFFYLSPNIIYPLQLIPWYASFWPCFSFTLSDSFQIQGLQRPPPPPSPFSAKPRLWPSVTCAHFKRYHAGVGEGKICFSSTPLRLSGLGPANWADERNVNKKNKPQCISHRVPRTYVWEHS